MEVFIMEYVKKVNGLSIRIRTHEEMDEVLKAKNDWGIAYYIPIVAIEK